MLDLVKLGEKQQENGVILDAAVALRVKSRLVTVTASFNSVKRKTYLLVLDVAVQGGVMHWTLKPGWFGDVEAVCGIAEDTGDWRFRFRFHCVAC